MLALVSLLAIAAVTWLVYSKWTSSSMKIDLPYVQFEGDNSAARYATETGSILAKGYAQYLSKGLPFRMRNPHDPTTPMVILPFKYLDEVKWVPEERMSFWHYIDRQSILTQIGGPGLTEEVTLAARQGLNRALVHIIEPLQEACLAGYANEMPPCPEWTSLYPYPLIVKIFAHMSACIIAGPELSEIDSEWQTLSMKYIEAVLSAPNQIRAKYPTWLYWLSRYLNNGVKTIWKHRVRAREILSPVLKARIAATEERLAQGGQKTKDQRKYEDGVQWLYDAHTAHGKQLTPDQLAQDIFVIMVASIHSTSSTGFAMMLDFLEHPEALPEILEEIKRVRETYPTWTRQALGELRILDSFMRECARVHSLTQYTSVQRILTSPWTFKDGLTIPGGATIAFSSYHHGFDPSINPEPEKFDAKRHLKKRQGDENTHKFHFASVTDDLLGWGAGRHACPGRFFAQETLKLMLIHLLTHYEFKHTEDTKDMPRYIANNMLLVPNITLPMLFREKQVSA